ncbi:ABC-type sulfate transport system permease component [Bradyrhizobium sp. LB7.2]
MGLTLSWLSIIILIPLAGLFLKSLELSLEQFWAIISSRRTLNALRTSPSGSRLRRPASIW